jgi:hypothetical protein
VAQACLDATFSGAISIARLMGRLLRAVCSVGSLAAAEGLLIGCDVLNGGFLSPAGRLLHYASRDRSGAVHITPSYQIYHFAFDR